MIMSRQRDWMYAEGGFEGWNGKWKNSASMLDLSFLSNPVLGEFVFLAVIGNSRLA